jgi:acyl transferase domain-containing protein
MKAKATPKTVLDAMNDIEESGQTPTVERIQTKIGGSPNTILALRNQIEKNKLLGDDFQEVAAVQLLIRKVRDRGRADRQLEIDSRNEELQTALLERDAARLNEKENDARYRAALLREALEVSYAGKLIRLQGQHAREVRELRRKTEKTKNTIEGDTHGQR